MDQLPKVLQQEIWEYVRGDRAYWKGQFNQTIQQARINPMRALEQGVIYEYKNDDCKFVVFWSCLNDGKWHIFLRETASTEFPPIPIQVYPRHATRDQEARAWAREWFWRVN